MNKTTRKNIISGTITVLILLGGFLLFQTFSGMKKSLVAEGPIKKERRQVEISSFSPETIENVIEIDGRLRAHEVVNIQAEVTGILLENQRTVKEGRYFRKGETLFSIDKQEAEYDLKAQKAALQTTITQMMPDLKFDYPEAFPLWEEYLNHFSLDENLAPLPENPQAQVKYFVSGRGVYNQYYNIKSMETRLEDYRIRAPFSGVITAVNVFPGALVSPGMMLATMINTAVYEYKSPIPLDFLPYVREGQVVNLYSEEMGQEWKGTVSRIGTQIDQSTQNVPIYITVSGSDLKDGMYLKGELKGNPLSEVVELPKRIFLSPESIYVIQDSTLVEKQVNSVKRLSETVIVRGLGGEDKVVTGSLAGLFTGQKVTY